MSIWQVTEPPQAGSTANALRGFGLPGLAAMLLILMSGNIAVRGLPIAPVGALLVLLWARLSHTPWPELGFVRPRRWMWALLAGALFGAAFKLVMKAVVMPLVGAPSVNEAYQFLSGNDELLPAAIWAMLVAGFSEETVFRGFLFERLEKMIGSSVPARIGIAILTSTLFAAGHYANQGIPGVQQALVMGLVFGSIYACTKSLWPLIAAHTTFDLTALALIYWGLEAKVAQAIFN